MSLTLDDFDYELPPERIAQAPLAERSASRLLMLNGEGLHDRLFHQLPQLLNSGDLLVMNDTRVLHARLFGRKPSGGKVEVMLERIIAADLMQAQVRGAKSLRPGMRLRLEDAFDVEVCRREGEFFTMRCDGDARTLIERHGRLPLPPYIARPVAAGDEARYQTVYARNDGSAAAPTAGLHFDAPLLQGLRTASVDIATLTLHVGAGTFQPVREHDLSRHRMHAERYELPAACVDAIAAARRRGGRIIAVGTTSLRALEAAAAEHDGELRAGDGETRLFITPGYRCRVVDRLITNFHLPKSTLLMLVSAFAGMTAIRTAYDHAIDADYRFFSYGDAMLIDRNDNDEI